MYIYKAISDGARVASANSVGRDFNIGLSERAGACSSEGLLRHDVVEVIHADGAVTV